jgi:serine phosphatase RsbU (regulator of sigma subunit)
MLVALIVGALDTAARENPTPEHLLLMLNERLCERGYATATCLAMKITAEGHVTIANAGHLPPYLNGREMEMEGALPLGTLPGMDYTAMCVQLNEGDSVVLMTDGVVEAQDEKGTLLGFDRIGEMIARQASAREVADAAQQHGQEDDILVLCLQRTAIGKLQAAAA